VRTLRSPRNVELRLGVIAAAITTFGYVLVQLVDQPGGGSADRAVSSVGFDGSNGTADDCAKVRQVEQLIAGPNTVYICNECVALCNNILGDDEEPAKA